MELAGSSSSNYVSSSVLGSQVVASCRICLLEMQEVGKGSTKLISPCRCLGSLQYVHEGCLTHWLQAHLTSTKQSIKCEVCKCPYSFSTDTRYIMRSWQQFKDNISQNQTTFLIKMVAIVLIISVLVMAGLMLPTEEVGSIEHYVSIGVFVLIPPFMLLWIVTFVFWFLLKREIIVVAIQECDR